MINSSQEPAECASVTNTITTKIAVTTEKIAISTLHHTSSVRTISFGIRVASSAVQPTTIPTPTFLRTTSYTGDHGSSIARSTKAPNNNPQQNSSDTGGVRILVGVLSAVLLLVILTVAVGIVVGLKCKRRGQVKITTAHNPAYDVVQRSDVPVYSFSVPYKSTAGHIYSGHIR